MKAMTYARKVVNINVIQYIFVVNSMVTDVVILSVVFNTTYENICLLFKRSSGDTIQQK